MSNRGVFCGQDSNFATKSAMGLARLCSGSVVGVKEGVKTLASITEP